MASGLPGKRVEAQRAGITIAAFMDELIGDRWQLAEETTLNRQPPTVNRLIIIALSALLITFSISRLYLLYGHKFYDITGRAENVMSNALRAMMIRRLTV